MKASGFHICCCFDFLQNINKYENGWMRCVELFVKVIVKQALAQKCIVLRVHTGFILDRNEKKNPLSTHLI